MKIIKIFDGCLEKLSRWGIVFSLFSILLLSLSAIILRWLGESVMWIEPLVRHMVFLSAFLGGSLATSKRVHIRVDLLTKLIETSKSYPLRWFHTNALTLFCFITTLILTCSSYDFFVMEREFGAPAFLDIHSSWLVGIIPFGMALICLRFFNQLVMGLMGEQK